MICGGYFARILQRNISEVVSALLSLFKLDDTDNVFFPKYFVNDSVARKPDSVSFIFSADFFEIKLFGGQGVFPDNFKRLPYAPFYFWLAVFEEFFGFVAEPEFKQAKSPQPNISSKVFSLPAFISWRIWRISLRSRADIFSSGIMASFILLTSLRSSFSSLKISSSWVFGAILSPVR